MQSGRRVIIKDGRRKPLQDQGERENAAAGERVRERGRERRRGGREGGTTKKEPRTADLEICKERGRTDADGLPDGGMKDEK